MRTTITIDDELLATARKYSGVQDIPSLVREALRVMIQVEAGRRLAAMGGTDPNATAAPRRRSEPE